MMNLSFGNIGNFQEKEVGCCEGKPAIERWDIKKAYNLH